jgi:putative tryptophan/tyrosine transport system substrate-binding protein
MRRRELILVLGGAMTAPRALRAQQKAMPVIGFLSATSPEPLAPYVTAFRQGLSEAGYIEGQNLAIEYRWAEGRYDRLPALAADLVGRKVDVIASTGGITPALAAKGATSTIPIVFIIGGDPVEQGLVTNLARPGGNLTGFSLLGGELIPKRLELLSELVPQASVIALFVNPNMADTERIIQDMQEAASTKGVQHHILRVGGESELDAAFASVIQLHAGALLVAGDPLFDSRRGQLVALASRHAVPTIYSEREFRRSWRADQLWNEPHGCLSPGRHLRRKDPQGRPARRSAGATAHDIRAGGQSQDREGARAYRAAIDPRPRRRGHRMTRSQLLPHAGFTRPEA